MLGLGWTEMLVIGVVALIVIGPKDLPMVMNRIGKIAGQVRRMGSEFQREINKTTGLDEVRNLRSSITAPLKKTSDEIRGEFNAMTPTGIKPSGVIKPADPKAGSVVDEIHAAAGLPKSNDQIAAEAGFKPQIPAEDASDMAVTAARKAPVRAKAVPTRPVITTDLRPVGEALDAMPAEATKAGSPKKAASKPKTRASAPVKKGTPAKTVPVLPTEPADTPTTPAPKKSAKRSPKPKTAPDVLPHEPADTPDATATAGKE